MITAKERRRQILFAIRQNPTSITVQRTERIAKDGGLEEVKTDLGIFQVRLFQDSEEIPSYKGDKVGLKEIAITWGMLADGGADLRTGPNITDQIVHPVLGLLKLIDVVPQMVGGEICGYQCKLRREQ